MGRAIELEKAPTELLMGKLSRKTLEDQANFRL
ncbi:hypothetical protein PSHI_48240 [Pseudomonas sp. URMO17WK12:I11]|nr:hypothetical protein PSHI_48240 [Pseudomonas sp. URMO17WK12:I11]